MRRAVAALLVFALGCGGGSSPAQHIDAGTGLVDAKSSLDAIPGIDARTGSGCTDTAPRQNALSVFVGPTGLQTRIGALIDGAHTSIDLQMYLFTVSALATKIIAAKNRGVAVRVLMDPIEQGNTSTHTKFVNAGVAVKDTLTQYPYAHAKYMIIDGSTVVIMSANFNAGAMSSERNYGVIDTDPLDIADAQVIFNFDYGVGPLPDLSCTRLLVSPINSQSRVLSLINGAHTSLDLELLYLIDSTIFSAVQQAKVRGVTVRVILSDPSTTPENTGTITTLKASNIPVHIATAFDVHAKLIIADGISLVASENMSYTSLTSNREVGVLVLESDGNATIQHQFDADFASTTAQ